MKILIADDSNLMRERIILLIEKISTKHIIKQATDGLEALEKSKEPALVPFRRISRWIARSFSFILRLPEARRMNLGRTYIAA